MKTAYQYSPAVKLIHPEWSKNAVIYQINTRQFTQEGTFATAEKQLPRLKALGVDILWLMPIHEIGLKNRKGTLGSPYSVKDYYSVNHEFGAVTDLKHFVQAAHELGMYVILDWVPNHTAWDNPLVDQHPDWYHQDWEGEFHPSPWRDWDDIIDLDYQQPDMREYMIEALKYWVRDVDIDGYRCDVAGFVPTDFWNQVRRELDAIKPVFMLAEWESRDLHIEAFDMTYGWSWYDTMVAIVKGQSDLNRLFTYYSHNEKEYPADVMRMLFVSNHDKNSWEGTMNEQFGEALEAVIALSAVSEGMPLIYNGQEAGEPKRLEFFEKDPIVWGEHPIGTLYQKLFAMRRQNTALWNAKWGARMVQVVNSAPLQVFSFVRQNEKDKVFAVFNFSDNYQSVTFKDTLFHGNYMDFSSGEEITMTQSSLLELTPWKYHIFIKV